MTAYDVLKAIYLERGYQPRAIPRLILEKNLYGLDIDDRAAQMAGFALLMKARADDRRLFTATDDAGNLQPPKLNVLSLQESKGLSVDELATHLAPFNVKRATIAALVETFEHAKTLGSLIQIPYALKTHLAVLPEALALVKQSGDMYASAAADDLLPLVEQAQVLAMQFDAVVANPPYMGSKGMNAAIQSYIAKNYAIAKSDLYACFILQSQTLIKHGGFASLVTLQNWMFYSTCGELREEVISHSKIESLIQIGFNSFPTLNSKVALAVAFALQKSESTGHLAKYFNCNAAEPSADKEFVFKKLQASGEFYLRSNNSFKEIPGSPISYWTSEQTRRAFSKLTPISDVARARQGLSTSNNDVFVRRWHEVSLEKIEFAKSNPASNWKTARRWVPYNKGGLIRRWYGNNEFVVDWYDNGRKIKSLVPKSVIRNESRYFAKSITWSDITIENAFRLQDPGFIFANSAHSAFCEKEEDYLSVLGILNSPVVNHFINALSQSLHFDVGYYNLLPYPGGKESHALTSAVKELVELARLDWDSRESSWNFKSQELLFNSLNNTSLKACFERCVNSIGMLLSKNIELENIILESAFSAYEIPYSDEYRKYHPKPVVAVPDRSSTSEALISYAIGCMMGRYSLDEPGLIYAHSGNVGFEPGRYATGGRG